ncbi:MAG: hypothetical protein ACJA0S_000638 [Rickettsiales bacterium]|jgi:hypothetical protein
MRRAKDPEPKRNASSSMYIPKTGVFYQNKKNTHS